MAEQNKLQLDFSGGQNNYKAPLDLDDNECELMVNYNHNKVGALKKRSGMSIVGSSIGSGYDVLQIALGAGYRRLVAVKTGTFTGALYRWDGSAWDLWKTSFSYVSSQTPHFESYLGYTFFAMDGIDMQSTSSSTLDTWGSTNCPNTSDDPQCKYVKRFEDRMYIASGNGTNEAARLWWSSLPDPSTNVLTWDIDNDWADIDPDSNSPIVGLDVNGGKLLIFKPDAIFRWQFGVTDADRIIGVGAFNQDSIKTNYELGITFFAGKYGVYSYSPFSEARPRLISRPIQGWFDAISDKSRVRVEIDIDNVYIYGGTSVTLDDETITNPIFVYNIPQSAWSIYSIASTAMGSASIFSMGSFPPVSAGTSSSTLQRTKPAIHVGDRNGDVYEFLTGTSDNGAPISTKFISKEYLEHFPEVAESRWLEVIAQVEGSTNTFIDIDRRNNWIPAGQLTARITYTQLRVAKGNSFRIQFTDNSIGDATIEGFNLEYEPETYHPLVKQAP